MSGNPVFVRLLDDLLPTTSLLMALYKAPGEPMCVAPGAIADAMEAAAPATTPAPVA